MLPGSAHSSVPAIYPYFRATDLSSTIDASHRFYRSFKVVMGQEKEPTLHQQQVFSKIDTHPKASLLVVLPTGSGKSALFATTAYAVNGCVLVVVPFVALIEDHLNNRYNGVQAIAFGSPAFRACSSWAKTVVLIEPEQVICGAFTDWMRSGGGAAVEKIFIDESHELVLSTGYRNSMQCLKHCLPAHLPKILLSGTVPFRMQSQLEHALQEPLYVIRAPCNRTNIRHQVSWMASKSSALSELAKQLQRFTNHNSLDKSKCRYIVYAATTQHCQDVHQELCERGINALLFTSNLQADAAALYKQKPPSQQIRNAKQAIYSEWVSTSNCVVVATSAFGAGVDMEYVPAVFTYGPTYTNVQYLQQAGRGGRKRNSQCLSWVFTSNDLVAGLRRYVSNSKDEASISSYEQHVNFLQQPQSKCRRMLLSAEVDGTGHSCTLLD
ncbi:hypothetical protein IWW36_004460, partial [Coemansia brasiliensis]